MQNLSKRDRPFEPNQKKLYRESQAGRVPRVLTFQQALLFDESPATTAPQGTYFLTSNNPAPSSAAVVQPIVAAYTATIENNNNNNNNNNLKRSNTPTADESVEKKQHMSRSPSPSPSMSSDSK